jgi:hypothetical protein
MLSEIQLLEINGILAYLKPERLSKMHLRKLQAIKNKVTGERDARCLCATPDRIKFYNEFLQWFEKNAWRLRVGKLRRGKGLR